MSKFNVVKYIPPTLFKTHPHTAKVNHFMQTILKDFNCKFRLPSSIDLYLYVFEQEEMLGFARDKQIHINVGSFEKLHHTSDGLTNLFKTLSHELVHIHQLHSGMLQVDEAHGKIVWRGSLYQGPKIKPLSPVPDRQEVMDWYTAQYQYYLNFPWEVHARNNTDPLYDQIFKPYEIE